MSDYTSVSLQKGLKEDLNRMKGDKETYSDVIHRALAALSEREDKQKSRHEELNKQLRQQNRLLVRMAVAQGLKKPLIPRAMAQDESQGDTIEQADSPLNGVFIPRPESNEETIDLLQDERQAEFDSIDTAHEVEVDDLDDAVERRARFDPDADNNNEGDSE